MNKCMVSDKKWNGAFRDMVQCRSMLNVFDPSAGHLPELLTSDLCRKKNAFPFNQTRGRVSPFFSSSSRNGNISKTPLFKRWMFG